ncbi:MAG TPA: hypothetical protein VF549_11335 [Solirubrobacteraceae bacterium]
MFAAACGVGYAGYVGYDSTFALIWGRRLAHGESPRFDGPFSPAPHPLLNVVGALLAPLGSAGAERALEVLALASMVLLGVAAFRLGAALFSPLAGAACALLMITRPEIVTLALFTQFDVAFLALVVLAAALEAENPRRAVAPLVALTFAGLLRPEAWIIAGAYALYLRRPRMLALAAAAPLLWALHDVLLTGDPLFSLHGTQDFAARHQEGNGIRAALRLAPNFVLDVTGAVVALGGVAGWLLVRREEQRRVALPAALFGLSVLPFLAYGALGLTLYSRFLLPAAAALIVLCAAGATGWARRWATPLVAVAVAVSLPFALADLADVRDERSHRADAQAELVELVAANRAVAVRCGLVHVPDFRLVPPLMHRLDLPGERFSDRATEARPALDVEIVALQPAAAAGRPPALAQSGSWRLRAGC